MASKAAREAIDQLLLRLAAAEAATTEYQGDAESLAARIESYRDSLAALQAAGPGLVAHDGQPTEVALEMLRALDDGENPDATTEDVFRASLAANQEARGRVLAFGELGRKLTDECARRFPAEQAAYQRYRTGGDEGEGGTGGGKGEDGEDSGSGRDSGGGGVLAVAAGATEGPQW